MTTPRERENSLDRWLQGARPGLPQPTPACLDGETAAAWLEGALKGAALDEAREHLAGCARCQAMMAAVMRAEDAAASTQAVANRGWRRWFTWAVPLTAAATALIALAVWLRVPSPVQRDPGESASTQRSATTEARSAEPSALPVPEAVPAPAAEPRASQDSPLPRQPPAGPPVEPPARSRADTSAARDLRDAAPLPKAAEEQASRSPASGTLGATAAAAPPVAGAIPSSRFESVALGLEIVSSDGTARWRVSGSTVRRSVDDGRTWSAVESGVMTALAAGSSPSANVCWLVGANGVVLRTTDGATIRRVPFPETVDLRAVVAADGVTAAVTTADGRRFATTDGGANWTPGDR